MSLPKTKVDPDGRTTFNCFERDCHVCPWKMMIGGRLACNYNQRETKGQKKLVEKAYEKRGENLGWLK